MRTRNWLAGVATGVILIGSLVAVGCGSSGTSSSAAATATATTALLKWQQMEEDRAPTLPGQYVDLPQAFAEGSTLAHYGASSGPNTNAHVTHDIDYSSEGYPPAGGPHWGSTACGTDPNAAPAFCGPALWGVYRSEWHTETLVQSLEDGGVVLWYHTSDTKIRKEIEDEAVKYLKKGDHVVMVPYSNLPPDTIALTAWARRDEFSLSDFSTDRIDKFIEAFNCRFDCLVMPTPILLR